MRRAARPRHRPPLPLPAYLRRHARRRTGLALLLALVFGLLVAADRLGLGLVPSSDLRRYDGRSFTVDRVVDGDTLLVAAPDDRRDTTRVRLWAIDAPELARPEEGRPAEPFADAARDRLRQLAEGRRVTLRLEPHRARDRYGRVLAFVELPDGTVVNEQLTLEGLARTDSRWPHRHVERYDTLQRDAKKRKAGLWGAGEQGSRKWGVGTRE